MKLLYENFEFKSQLVSFYPLRDPENYGIISGEVKNPKKKGFIVELLDEEYKVIQKVDNILKYQFDFVKPSIYYVRLIVDENRNSRWDAGDLEKNILPEVIQVKTEKIKFEQ